MRSVPAPLAIDRFRCTYRYTALAAILVLFSAAATAQGRKVNTNVGQAFLQIQVVVMPILSTPPAQCKEEDRSAIRYEFPVAVRQTRTIVQELPIGRQSKEASGLVHPGEALITSTFVVE